MANVNEFAAKTSIDDTSAAVLVDQNNNVGYIMDLDVLAEKVLDNITNKTFANHVGGSSAATLLAQLSTLNGKIPSVSEFSVTAASNVVIDVSKCETFGKFMSIKVTGHTTADKANATLFSWSGVSSRDAFVFPLAIGARWDISRVGYGFVSGTDVKGTVPSGDYFHVVLGIIAA